MHVISKWNKLPSIVYCICLKVEASGGNDYNNNRKCLQVLQKTIRTANNSSENLSKTILHESQNLKNRSLMQSYKALLTRSAHLIADLR